MRTNDYVIVVNPTDLSGESCPDICKKWPEIKKELKLWREEGPDSTPSTLYKNFQLGRIQPICVGNRTIVVNAVCGVNGELVESSMHDCCYALKDFVGNASPNIQCKVETMCDILEQYFDDVLRPEKETS